MTVHAGNAPSHPPQHRRHEVVARLGPAVTAAAGHSLVPHQQQLGLPLLKVVPLLCLIVLLHLQLLLVLLQGLRAQQ